MGGRDEVEVDVRVLAATNRDIEKDVETGAFRQDLFYRLNVIRLHLPPLRERAEDIPLLAAHLVRKHAALASRDLTLSEESVRWIARQPYPGNVRELENVIERAVIVEDGDTIRAQSLPEDLLEEALAQATDPRRRRRERPDDAVAEREMTVEGPAEILSLEQEEERAIRRALEITGWNLQETAQRLGIGRATIYRKMDRYGIERR